jgi:FdhD protein
MAREKPLEAPPYSAAPADLLRLPDGTEESDQVAVEEPLEIRIGGRPVAVTMRTPGTTRSWRSASASPKGSGRRAPPRPADLAANTIEAEAPDFDPARLQRSFYTSSSCGVCGKGALEAVAVGAPQIESRLQVPAALLADLPERLRTGPAGLRRDGRASCNRPLHGRRRAPLPS